MIIINSHNSYPNKSSSAIQGERGTDWLRHRVPGPRSSVVPITGRTGRPLVAPRSRPVCGTQGVAW